MTYALMLAFFRNDMGFGGNNGLTDYKDILGWDVHWPATRLGALSRLRRRRSALGYLLCRFITASKLGRVLLALRDAESRVRFLGYSVDQRQAVRLHRLGGARRDRRRALRAAGRHHQPERILARQFDRDRDLGLGRRPRHACLGPIVGAVAGQPRQDLADRRGARDLAVLFSARCSSLTTLVFPRGSSASSGSCRWRADRVARRRWRSPVAAESRHEAGVADRPTTLLYLNGVTVSFDGFKALNDLSLVVEEGELRTIIGPNGAGKTTMMDVVTGKTRPDPGEVFFGGIGGSDPPRRGRDRQSRHRAASSSGRPCSKT